MDIELLHRCFSYSLSPDQSARQFAEGKLDELSHSTGFLAACLDIINYETDPLVKQATCIYFKNTILKHWAVDSVIDSGEKPVIREKLFVFVTKLDRVLRNQLLPALSMIINHDYPDKWNSLIDDILEGIKKPSDDINSLYVAIYAFAEICRSYRWKNNKERHLTLDPIINAFFPYLLNIGKQLASDPSLQNSYEASEILKLIIKCYKFVTYLDFPETLQTGQPLIDWITFHVEILQINYSADAQIGWIKSQKWAYHNLYRLFQRYGTKTISSKFDYKDFRVTFRNEVLPQLINVYIDTLKRWIANEKYLADSGAYYLMLFLEQALLTKSTFALIDPHFNFLIGEVAFKIFNPKDEDLELYEDEPEEYIHKIFEYLDECTAEDALYSFLFTLVEKNSNYITPIFQMIVTKFQELNNQEETLEVAKGKEALMKFVSPIAYKLSQPDKNPAFNDVEPFFSNVLIPNFQSKFPFIRARCCNVVSKFDNLDFKSVETIQNLYNGIISNFLVDCTNETLPIQLQAAVAIQTFVINETFKSSLEPIILPLMEKLMELSNKFDSEVLPAVMQEIVESFPQKLEPFAEQLMEQLCLKLHTLLLSIADASNAGYDDYEDFENSTSDKSSTALGIVSTMITILLYFENSTEIIGKLEVHYSKIIKTIFELKIEDFYAEGAELIENTLFLTRNVSQLMWSLFGDFVNSLLEDDDITLYLEDSLPALKNYLIYGSDVVQKNVDIQQLYMRLIMNVFEMDVEESDIGFSDILHASDLATTFVLALSSECNTEIFTTIVNYSVKGLVQIENMLSPKKSVPYRISLINNIVACLVINPLVTLSCLNTQQMEIFFTNWFNITSNLKRVFDIKLSILGYVSLLNIDLATLNNIRLTSLLDSCGSNMVKLFIAVPGAIKDLEKKREEFSEKKWSDEVTYNINQVHDEDEGDEFNEDLGDGDDEDEYEDMFQNNTPFNFESEDELQDDPYSNTSLDKINIFTQFQGFIVKLQTNESDKYNLVFNGLSDEDKSGLNSILSNI